MRILKIKGKNEETILGQIKKEYGDLAVVISTQQEKETGIFKWFKAPKTVVTIAVKDQEDYSLSAKNESQKEQPIDTVAYNVLLSLKDQIETMQSSITDLKRSNEKHHMPSENKESNKIIDILKAKLSDEGINQELLDIILKGISEECEVEEIVRILYVNIEELLKKGLYSKNLPQIVFFIGPTGVGKTTTIAKLTADYVLNRDKKVVLFTSDTYRIAAIDQLKTYADILGVDIEIIYEENELIQYIEKWKHADHIFIDTAGRSHKNSEQIEDIKNLLASVEQKQVFLVLNANTSCKDVKSIVGIYEKVYPDFELIITKLDETDEIGNVMNIAYYANRPILYLTHGQNVPADISGFNADEYTSYLLGRINYE
ncbi:GTPase [Cellulosilyticum sp. I15G10I2]|uniref:GTPase n=1 Tax=Cellulosilyticum sp. I15G10I2 TaxID=1892843 RepID=UPI00085C9702|nr:GTPase [Cellulosilyticum sp. I15G10I2]